MAGGKGIEQFDNKHLLYSKEAFELIKNYVRAELPFLTLEKEYDKSTGQWGIQFRYRKVKVFIESDRGFLEWQIEVNDQEIPLERYENDIINIEASSRRNIEYLLRLIKEVLDQLHGSKI